MNTTTISLQCFEQKLSPASLEWRAGPTREKFLSFVLSNIDYQRKHSHPGAKMALGLPCIYISAAQLRHAYKDQQSRAKLQRVLLQYGLIKKDRSWVSQAIAKKAGVESHSDSWHFVDPEDTDTIELRYGGDFSQYGWHKACIMEMEGVQKDGLTFHGAWAVEAYSSGSLCWQDFIQVAIAARKFDSPTSSKDCRVFDAVTLCKKEFRDKCFGLHECLDIRGSASWTAPIALSIFNDNGRSDKELFNWAYDMEQGCVRDPYKLYYNAAIDRDPHTTALGKLKWDDKKRKRIKDEVNCLENYSQEKIRSCKEAYDAFFKDPHNPRKYLQRGKWVLLAGIQKADKPLYNTIFLTKQKNLHNGFYRLSTAGEKIIMSFAMDVLRKQGYKVYRVHDALWTSDAALDNRTVEGLLGKALQLFLKQRQFNPYGRDGIRALATRYLTEDEINHTKEAIQ